MGHIWECLLQLQLYMTPGRKTLDVKSAREKKLELILVTEMKKNKRLQLKLNEAERQLSILKDQLRRSQQETKSAQERQLF